jgi:hypothetical protein
MHIEYSPEQSLRDAANDVFTNEEEERDLQVQIQDDMTSSYSGNSGYTDERNSREEQRQIELNNQNDAIIGSPLDSVETSGRVVGVAAKLKDVSTTDANGKS